MSIVYCKETGCRSFPARFLFQPAFFGAAGDDVADRGDGVDVEHARRAVAHDGADRFAHLRLVAVDAAVGAEGFLFP